MRIAHHAATGALTIIVTLTCAGNETNQPPVVSEAPTQEQVVTEHNLYTHHCHEDEYQFVMAEGLACAPIDNLNPDHYDRLPDSGFRVVATEYEFARP